MALNPDAAQQLEVSFRPPRAGSCLTPEVLEEIASLLQVKLSPAALSSQSSPCVSNDSNNLASLDAEGCVLVPGAKLYTEEQVWAVAGGADLDFDGFTADNIDALTCLFSCYIFLDSGETGIEVNKTAGGTAFIRPNLEVKSITSNKITIAVKNALSDVRVVVQLLQLPVPPQQA